MLQTRKTRPAISPLPCVSTDMRGMVFARLIQTCATAQTCHTDDAKKELTN